MRAAPSSKYTIGGAKKADKVTQGVRVKGRRIRGVYRGEEEEGEGDEEGEGEGEKA